MNYPKDLKLKDPSRPNQNKKQRYVTVLRSETFWVEKARENPVFFQHYMTGMQPAKHHKIWLTHLFNPDTKRLNLIAPRESAKTTTLLNAMAWFIGKFPWTTNGIISVSADQSEKRLAVLKDYIEYQPRYQNVFPDVYIDKTKPDTKKEFTVWSSLARNGRMPTTYNVWKMLRNRQSDDKDPTLFALGRGGKGVIGKRINGILWLDDIIDEEDLTSEAQKKVLRYIMQTLIPCVKEDGRCVNIGTRWMIGDVPESLANNPSWHTINIPAKITDPTSGEEKSYWPEYWPVEKLDRKRDEMQNDTLFRIMYLNDPSATTANLFTREALSRGLPEKMPELLGFYIGCDLAISKKTRADYTWFSAIGIDAANNLYYLKGDRLKGRMPELVRRLLLLRQNVEAEFDVKLYNAYSEKVAFQGAFLDSVTEADPTFPIIGYTPKGDKDPRLSIVSRICQNGKFFFNKQDPTYPVLLSELMNYPARHDDGPDSISIVTQALNLGSLTETKVEMFRSAYLL